jgi:hypothetical protein
LAAPPPEFGTRLDAFLDALRDAPDGPLFNPWYQVDRDHDLGPESPQIRLSQLRHYLESRRTPRVLLIAEALGYQGGHFTGMAMTSERILLGHQKHRGITAEHVLPGLKPRRTSIPEVQEKGFNEPTATIVCGAVVSMGVPTTDVVHWNAVPWHPYKPDKGLLTNRTPKPAELAAAAPLLKQFLELYPDAAPVAVGRKCEAVMADLGVTPAACVRHPANGGAPKFRAQLADFLSK